MKTLFKSLFREAATEGKIAFASPRFSYIDNVIDEEYNDHLPYVDPDLKPTRLELALEEVKLFCSRLIYRVVTVSLFVLYYLVHSALKAVRFIR